MNQLDPDPARPERVEELAYQCLDGLEARGPEAVDQILADHEPRLQEQVRGMLAILSRVGLARGGLAGSEPALPERLGPYRLLECIGAGSMGVVYRAQREDDPAELALKLLQPGLLPIRGTRVRFRREIAALRELHHEGICPILDDGEIEGVPFLAMPFVPGESLRAHFARGAKGANHMICNQLITGVLRCSVRKGRVIAVYS